MKYSIEYTERFKDDLETLEAHLEANWGRTVLLRFTADAERLLRLTAHYPEMHPSISGYPFPVRRMLIPPYNHVYYEVDDDTQSIFLLTLWVGRREGSPRL